MIFINKNADYSADAIEKITIPIPMLRETTTLLSKYTKEVTTEEKRALNNVISFLVENNLYNKISLLSIPYFAGSVAEALANMAGSTIQESDYDAEKHPTYSLETYGLKVAVDSDTTYPSALTPYTDSVKKTILASWYQITSTPFNNAAANIGNDFFPGTNQYVIARKTSTEVTVPKILDFNVELLGNSGDTLSASTLYKIFNGVERPVTITSGEGTTLLARNTARIAASSGRNDPSFCMSNGNLSMLIVFNEPLSKTMAASLGEIVEDFNAAIKEANA